MVKNVNKLKGKIAEKGYTFKKLSEELGLTELTLRRKMNDNNYDFYLGETTDIAKILELSGEEYLEIFYGSKLEFNS